MDDTTLPPHLLPADDCDIVIECPTCRTRWLWIPELADDGCPKCGRGIDEPVN